MPSTAVAFRKLAFLTLLLWCCGAVVCSTRQTDHPERIKEWHQAVVNIYKRQVIATHYMQQQGLGMPVVPLQLEDVQPSQFLNDGYIWLALTHHLLGAGQLSQVRCGLLLLVGLPCCLLAMLFVCYVYLVDVVAVYVHVTAVVCLVAGSL